MVSSDTTPQRVIVRSVRMGSIGFHSPSGEVSVSGHEHARLSNLIRKAGCRKLNGPPARGLVALAAAEAATWGVSPESPYWMDNFRTLFGNFVSDQLLSWNGQEIDTFGVILNTAIAVDTDPMKLAARLHAQCEIHTYVEGPNRAWLADIVQAGLNSDFYRATTWQAVVDLLRSRNDEPVVTSHSTCDGFPSWHATDWGQDGVDEEDMIGAWYELPDEQQWELAMTTLRIRSSAWRLELKPDDWDTYRLDVGLTVMDLLAQDWQERVEKALAEPAAG